MQSRPSDRARAGRSDEIAQNQRLAYGATSSANVRPPAAFRCSRPEPITWGSLGDALPDAFPQSHPMNAAPVRPPCWGRFFHANRLVQKAVIMVSGGPRLNPRGLPRFSWPGKPWSRACFFGRSLLKIAKIGVPPRGPCRICQTTTHQAFDPKEFLARVGEGKTIVEFRKDQVVFAQGDVANTVFYIQQGRVKVVVISEQGKEAVVGILGPGQFFGEGCMNGHSLRIATTTAMEECLVTAITKAAMLAALHEPAKVFRIVHGLFVDPE